jgi:hypothetical protein
VRSKNERVELEMKILRYRKLARQIATDPDTAQRSHEMIADLEKELREIDGKGWPLRGTLSCAGRSGTRTAASVWPP